MLVSTGTALALAFLTLGLPAFFLFLFINERTTKEGKESWLDRRERRMAEKSSDWLADQLSRSHDPYRYSDPVPAEVVDSTHTQSTQTHQFSKTTINWN